MQRNAKLKFKKANKLSPLLFGIFTFTQIHRNDLISIISTENPLIIFIVDISFRRL